MISATPPLRTSPSFWLTSVCLLVSGTVAGLFVGLLMPALRFSESDLGTTLLYITIASALIGGLVLRAVLPRLAGAAISYPWAVAALGLGGAAGNAFLWVVQRGSASSAGPLFGLGATALSLVVSYYVVVAGSRDIRGAVRAPPVFADLEAPATTPANAVARAEAAVTRTCIEISRVPSDQVPGVVIDALTELGTCAHMLRNESPRDPAVRAAVAQLVDGLDRFQEALTEIAASAAALGTDKLYQRGALFPSMADVSDGGGSRALRARPRRRPRRDPRRLRRAPRPRRARRLGGDYAGRRRGAAAVVGEPAVDDARAAAALVDRPHDQRLPAACVARGEDTRDRRRELRRVDVAARVALDAELLEQRRLGADEAHREQHELARDALSSVPGTGSNGGAPLFSRQWICSTAPRAGELRRRDREAALAALLQRVRGAELHRPERPRRQVVGPRDGRLAEQLDLRHRRGLLAVRARDAVGAGVAAADHDHVLARRA